MQARRQGYTASPELRGPGSKGGPKGPGGRGLGPVGRAEKGKKERKKEKERERKREREKKKEKEKEKEKEREKERKEIKTFCGHT